MLSPGPATKIYLGSGVTDMRKSFNGLYALVAATLESDPLSGPSVCFLQIVGATGSRSFALTEVGCGFVRNDWNKALSPGRRPVKGAVELTQAELNLLLGGFGF